MTLSDGCGAPEQTIELPAGIDLSNQAVIQGKVSGAGPAYARLLDGSGEFTGEVVVSEEGIFRFLRRSRVVDRPHHRWWRRVQGRSGRGQAG